MFVLGPALAVVRLTRGHQVGAWTGLYAVGIVLAGLGGILARRGSTRLASVAVIIGCPLLGLGDATAGPL
ncbi:hypothetical protein [Streptomyces halobius]|uniref:MFS transporter n=1 Tax=Streptomyces halobius TaxID=2879846 RepID=A0ABY4M4V0_9ACTN|nr:hypothetical protein [Streptomyces halobius]UQA91844.1 hypothetical protein K9S39_08225 [Streptomyces halobius]